jgi:hypothetical protein
LAKRFDKNDPRSKAQNSGYLRLSLSDMRGIADKIRAGVVQAATLDLHLRCRNRPIEKIPSHLRAYADEPLPEMLEMPEKLELQDRP